MTSVDSKIRSSSTRSPLLRPNYAPAKQSFPRSLRRAFSHKGLSKDLGAFFFPERLSPFFFLDLRPF